MGKDTLTRFTLSLPRVTKELIERLAEAEGVSVSVMMQRLLEDGLSVDAVRAEGGELIARFSDGRQVTLPGRKKYFQKLIDKTRGGT